jgi:hypothetical protein
MAGNPNLNQLFIAPKLGREPCKPTLFKKITGTPLIPCEERISV